MQYDVIVVGAGIPGLYAARELARKKKKVLILDLSQNPGDPNYSTAGTPIETITLFDLPNEGIAATVTRFLYATKNTEAIKDSDHPVSYVLDFRKTKVLLAEQIQQAGGEVQWGVQAKKFQIQNDEITLQTSKGDFTTRYLIDASGSTGQIAVQAGIRETRPSTLSVGIEYIVSAPSGELKKFDHALAVYLDTELCPYGYAWVFDEGNQTYKVGLAEYYVDPKRKLPSLDNRLSSFLNWVTEGKNVAIEEKHGGSKFITTNFDKVYSGNVIAIGDVIGAINPLFGEGIRHGLYSAKFALEAIEKQENKTGTLQHYQDEWEKYIGNNWKITERNAHLLYDKADADTQNLYETLVRHTQKYSTPQTIINSGYYYKSKSFFASPIQNLELIIAALKAHF
jgi:digeranylgeranylglycerophospholipid reductase